MKPHQAIEAICAKHEVSPRDLTRNIDQFNGEWLTPCLAELVADLSILYGSEKARLILKWSVHKFNKYRTEAPKKTRKEWPRMKTAALYLQEGQDYITTGNKIGLGSNTLRMLVASKGGKEQFIQKHLRA